MSKPSYAITASVILVQLDEGDKIYVTVNIGGDGPDRRRKIILKPILDTSNRNAWLSEALSALLEQI